MCIRDSYIIPDVDYEQKRNRIMAYNKPLISLYRRIERVYLKLVNGETDYIKNKIISKIKRKQIDEK